MKINKPIAMIFISVIFSALFAGFALSACPSMVDTPNELRSELRAIILDFFSDPLSSSYTTNEILDLLDFYKNEKSSVLIDTCDNTGTKTNTPITTILEKTIDFQEECTTPGETRSCGKSDVGECSFGTQSCQSNNQWGNCIGEIAPSVEICDGKDNNCDGTIDENCGLLISASPSSVPSDSITPSTITASTSDNMEGVVISFTSNRNEDTLSHLACTTASDGKCSITIKSTKIGESTITASAFYYTSGTTAVNFVAPCSPSPEICDNLDNNCDTFVDEGCDDDNDNYCDVDMTTAGTPNTCTLGGLDCNDADLSINPGSGALCNYDASCSAPADDSRCPIVDCYSLNYYYQSGTESATTTETCYYRDYADIASNRCEGYNDCKEAADCSSFSDVSKYTCSTCQFIAAGACAGTTLGSCSNYAPGTSCGSGLGCDGSGNCVTCDADGDGHTKIACGGDDCDDNPLACGASCFPGSTSYTTSPDGYDQDCDGIVDESSGGGGTSCYISPSVVALHSAMVSACSSYCGGDSSVSASTCGNYADMRTSFSFTSPQCTYGSGHTAGYGCYGTITCTCTTYYH